MKSMEKRTIEISWATLWKVLAFIIFAVVLFYARDILLGLFMALVISSGLDAAVDFLERRKFPRYLGVILIFFFGVVALAVLVSFVIPLLVSDVSSLLSGNGIAFQDLLGHFGGTDFIGRTASDFLSGSSANFFSNVLGGLGLAGAVLVTSFYLALSRDGIERFIQGLFPNETGARALRVYTRSRRKVGRWFQSQMLLSVIMGFLVWGTLALLGVKHALVLGVLAGVLELVPFVGPIISGAVAVLVALTTSTSLALSTMAGFLVLQQLETHFLVPLLMQKAINMHPVVVIIALLIGIEVGGLIGALVAVPAAAVIQEVLAERG